MTNGIRSTPAIHWKCEQYIYIYSCILSITFLMRFQSFKIDCSLVFHNLSLFTQWSISSWIILPNRGWWRYLAFQMGSIQRLLCITFMTSQSHLRRYCCLVMSHGPWLLRRCFKRGFGNHRRQPINEFDWIVISTEIQLVKTANLMAKIITLPVCK